MAWAASSSDANTGSVAAELMEILIELLLRITFLCSPS
jgi:hypothetical protein